MIAVLDQGEGDIVSGKMLNQPHGMGPGYVRVLHALQDVNRASGLDRRIEQEMAAPILDQPEGDRRTARPNMPRVADRRPVSTSGRSSSSVKRSHISLSVKSTAGAMRTMPAGASLSLLGQAFGRQKRDPAAHGGADEDRPLPGVRWITARLSSSQREIVPSSKRPSDSPWPE